MSKADRARKRGRPRKPYRTSWGEHVNGLRRRKDGRWVIVDTGQTFVEPDERRAVARFRRWEAEQQQDSITELSVPIESFESRAGVQAAMESGAAIHGFIDGSMGVGVEVPEVVLWAWVREQLIEHPERVAEQTGIPEVARLAELPKPVPSPTLVEIGNLYQSKSTASQAQRRRAKLFWGDFQQWLEERGVNTLRELTPGLVAEYGDKARARGDSPKYLKHRFTTVRTVINFARKRGMHPQDVRHALDCCAVLQVPREKGVRDPNPIGREEFEALLTHAAEPRMKAMLLVMLNLCMYPAEALNLDWGEIDLNKKTIVTDRSKTTVVRIGVLWDRTVKALRAIRPKSASATAPIFLSRQGNRWNVRTFNTQYRQLRKQAGVAESVKAEHCRDGAYTAAVNSGVDWMQAKLLAGHATGISDYYAKRRPTMVENVVRAIEAEYFGE